MLTDTAKRAIDAYGGVLAWQNAKSIEAEVSVKGLAFILKQRPFFCNAKIQMEINRPFSKLTPIGKDVNIRGILDGDDVRLEDAVGNMISERRQARTYFPYGRRLLYWDDLDMAYFANYAFWNYFTFPALLMNNSIKWVEKNEGLLEATFPDSLPTHSKVQSFQFDLSTGLLVQHNYTVDIISKFARAANIVKAHAITDGLKYPAARQVTPRKWNNKPMLRPVLIDMRIHKYTLSSTLVG